MPLRRYSGVFDPADLATLQKVFDQLCKERRVPQEDTDERERLAEEIVTVFQQGFVGETDFIQLLSKRRRKK